MISKVLSTRFLSAENKRLIFFSILEEKEKKFFKKNQTVLCKISDVYTKRNTYGHQALITTEKAIERYKKNKSITLYKFAGKEEVILPYKEFVSLVEKASNCATTIRGLLETRKYLSLYGHNRTAD